MKKLLSVFLLFAILVSSPIVAVRSCAASYVGNSNKIQYVYNKETKTLIVYGNGKLGNDIQRDDPFDLAERGFFYRAPWFDEVEIVVVQEGVENLPNDVFKGLSIKAAYIPKSVTEILWAFVDCYNLSDIYYPGTITQWNKINFPYQRQKRIHIDYRDSETHEHSFIYPTTHILGSKTGWTTENKKTFYLTDENVALYGIQSIDGKTYIFDDATGQLLKGKVNFDGAAYITSKTDGHMLYGKVKCDGKYYVTNRTTGKMMYGYVQCNGKKYVMSKKTGEMLYGRVRCDGKHYIASKTDGHLFLNAKVKCDGKTYYTDKTGAVIE